jgi:YggT family protein
MSDGELETHDTEGGIILLYGILILIVNTITSILTGVMLLRFWLQAIRVRPPMSVGEFIYKLSDWLVKPLRKVLPGVGGYDWASVIGALLMVFVATLVEHGPRTAFAWDFLLLAAAATFVTWILYAFIILIIIEAILSWVNPRAELAPFIRALNEPLLRPLRRVVPLLGNIDLSPLVAILLLQIALRLVSAAFASL